MKRILLKPLLMLSLACGGGSGAYWLAKKLVNPSLPAYGEPVVFYANQTRDDLGKLYQNSIADAKKSILLLIYNLSDTAIIQKLNRKAEEGVAITIICDAEASRNVQKRLNSKIKVFPQENKGLMHLKVLVVDEHFVLIGSANLSRYSLKIHGNLVNGFYSSELGHFIAERAQNIIKGQEGDTVLEKTFSIGGQEVEFWFLPNDPQAVRRIIRLIDSARKSIRIAMFTWTRKDFAHAVIRSALRGVKVEVVLDKNASKGSSKKIARLLLREKVPVNVNSDGGLLHHKMMIVDSEILVNGSANWTKAAFTSNHDCFMIVHPLTSSQQRKINNLWEMIKSNTANYRSR